MSDTTSPTFLNGSLQLVLGSDPNNSSGDTSATNDDIIHGSDISMNDYSGRFIAVNDEYLFVSKNPSTGTHNSADDLLSRSYITVFKLNHDGTQTQVTTIPQPSQYEASTNHSSSYSWVGSIDVDNDYLVVGCPNHKALNANGNPQNHAGAIVIYKKDTGAETWSLKHFIAAPDVSNYGTFGISVAICDGYIAATKGNRLHYGTTVTKDNVTDYEGSVFIFKKDNTDNWSFLNRIKNPPAESNLNTSSNWEDWFGHSLEMYGDWLAISDPRRRQKFTYSNYWYNYQVNESHGLVGTVFLYKRDTTSYNHFTLKTTIIPTSTDQSNVPKFEGPFTPASNSIAGSDVLKYFGTSISLYKNTLMVGSPNWYWSGYGSQHGAIYIYDFNNETGKAELQYMYVGDSSSYYAGIAVNIYENRAICSRYYNSIITFKKTNGIWGKVNMINKYGWFTSTELKYRGGNSRGGIRNKNLKLNNLSIFFGDANGDKTHSNTGGVYRFPFTQDKNHLLLTFNENLRYDINIDKTDFALQENYINNDILDTKIESGLIKIEPKKDIEDIKKLAITYTKNATSGTPLDVGDTVSVFASSTSSSQFFPRFMTQVGSDYYVTDADQHKIWKVTYDGVITHFSGSAANSSSSGWTTGNATTARYIHPQGIVTDGTNLFVADHNPSRILKVDLNGTSSLFVGNPNSNYSSGTTDGIGTNARFYYPKGLAIDNAKKNIYVCDNQNNRIRKINIATREVTTITTTNVSQPHALVITKDDRYLYVGIADPKLRKIDLTDNSVTTIDTYPWPSGTHPYPSAIDPNGEYIYMTGRMYHGNIYRLKVVDDTITLFAGNGNGNSGTVGALLSTEFTYSGKNRIFIDNNFNVLISENDNNRILKIASTGGSRNIMDFAGNAVESFTHNFDDIKPTHTTTEIVSGSGSGSWTENTTSPGSNKDWSSITSSSNGTKLAATVYNGNIWTSNDSGATWTEITVGDGSNPWRSITSSSDGTKLAAVASDGGKIWISNDSGATWTDNTSPTTASWYSITSSSDGTKLAAVIYGSAIYTSSDSGANWSSGMSPTKNWQYITSSSDGTKLAAVVYGGNIWTSNDSGATWTEVTSMGGGFATSKNWRSITMSADGTKIAAVVRNGNIWTSNDSGATWTEDTSIGATKDWRSITSSADGTKLTAGTNGNMWTSSDSGATWTEVTSTGSSKNWSGGITSSADGKKLAAAPWGGNIWTIASIPSKFVLSFSEIIKDNANIDKNDFSVIFEDVAHTISSVEISDGKVNITPAVAELCDVEITYTKNATSSKNITDRADNAVDTFTFKSKKRGKIIDFSLKDTRTNTKINIGFSEYIRNNENIDKNDFTVSVNGSALPATKQLGNSVELFIGDGSNTRNFGTSGSLVGCDKPGQVLVLDDFYYIRDLSYLYKVDKNGCCLSIVSYGGSNSPVGGFVYLNRFFYWPYDHQIKKISLDTLNVNHDGVSTLFVGGTSSGHNDGNGTTAKFQEITDITTDNSDMYIVEKYCVRKISLNGDVTTLAGTFGISGDVDGIGTAVKFMTWTKTITYHNNYLYIADNGNKKIKKLNLSNNEVTTIITNSNTGIHPQDVEVIGSKLYVSYNDSKIYRYDLDGSNEEHFAGNGAGNQTGDLLTSKFDFPYRISHHNGDIFIGERDNHCVKIIKGVGNNIEYAKTKNGTILLNMSEKISAEKHNISISYTKNSDTNKQLLGMNNFSLKSFTSKADTEKPTVKDIFVHYSNVNAGTSISGQTYRETDNSFNIVNDGGGTVGARYLASAGNYIMLSGLGSTNGHVFIYYYDGTNWNQQKVLSPEGNNYAQTGYYLTQDYAFINRSSTTNKGKVVVYKRDGINWNEFQTIEADDIYNVWYGTNNNKFGLGILSYKDYLVITGTGGAFQYNSNGAYIFKMNSENTSYVHHSIVGHGYPVGFYYFGSPLSNNVSTGIKCSMAMSDDYLCISAMQNKNGEKPAASGVCFIYKKLDKEVGGWNYYKTIEPSIMVSGGNFGCSLQINNRFLMISQKNISSSSNNGVINVYDIYQDFKYIQTINPNKNGFGTNFSLSKDNILVSGGNHSNDTFIYKYNGVEFVQVHEIKKQGYTVDPSLTTNNFGFTSQILNDVIIVTDYSSSGNNNSNIYSSQLVKSDNKLIEVCFTKKISDNSNVDKNDFTIKTDGVSNDIVSVSINSGKLLFTVTNDVVNESTIQLTYTKNNDATKNIFSQTLIVDSFNTKPTPNSFTLEDKGFVISGSKQNTSVPNISLRKTDELIDFSTSGYDRVYSSGNHQVFSNDSNELLFTTTGSVHVGNNSAAKHNGFGKYWNRSYQSFVIMWKKVNNVWTKMHRFSVWDHEPTSYTTFGHKMVYHNGYLLVSAPSVDSKGAIYLLKYNPSTRLMETVASKRRYDLTPGPASSDSSFGNNIAMDDKYIYASGWDTDTEIFVLDYSLELIFVTSDFSYILNKKFGNYEKVNFYSHSKCRAFFKNGNYYLLQVVQLHNYKGDNGSDINGTNLYVVVLLKKHETLDNWTLHQVLHDVNAFPSKGRFGYTTRNHNINGYDVDTNADTIFVSYQFSKQLLNNVDDIETIGGVYVFKFNVTTGLWGDDNVYSNAHFNSNSPNDNSLVVNRWSERISYPNDIIIDTDLYKFAPYNSNHLDFGSIKYDSKKERLLISQIYGKYDTTYNNRGSISVYKNINNKYKKISTIINRYNIFPKWVGYPLGTTESGDVYFTGSEDVGIAYGSTNKVFVVNFTKKIKLGRNFNKNTLTVKKNGTTVSISNVYIDDTKLFIVCNESLDEIEKSYVLYTPTSIVDENILSDNLILDSFTYGNVTSAVVTGMVLTNNKLELSFTKTILHNPNLLFQDFEVYISGIKKKVKTVEVSNSKLLIEINETISDINLVKVIYIKNSEYNYNLIDNNGVSVETFEHIQNSSNTTFSAQTIASGNVQIEFSDTILDNTNIDTNDFELFISGQANSVSSVSVSNGKVLVGLSAATQNSNINDICVIYRKNSNKKKQLKNIYGVAIDNFITNTETATPELSLNTHYYSSYYSENTFGALYDEYDWNTINSQINSVGSNLYHGYSVKLDGNYMFISQHKYNSFRGRVAIYKYQNSSWSILKYIDQPHSGYDYFGYSLSYQNDYLIVSSPREDTGNTDAGSVYIYKKDEGGADNWGNIKTLRNPGVGGIIDSYSYFGDSIDMDGDYLLVSAYGIHERRNGGDYNNAGAVFLFKKDEGGTDNWGLIKTIQSQIIVTYTNAYYGQDVSIKDDVFVISNRYTSTSNQGTEIYLRNGDNWEFSETIYHSDSEYGGTGGGIQYGYTVKTDGTYILIYARYGNISGGSGNSGIVFLYSRDINNKFRLVKGFGIPTDKSIFFGMSLDINDDVIAIGAPEDNVTGDHDGGAVYIYSKNEGGKNNWGLTSVIRRGYQYDEGTDDGFGGSNKTISLNYQSSGMIIGAPYDDVGSWSNSGNVYIVNQGLYVTEKNKIVLNTGSFIKDTTLDVNDFSVQSYTGVKTITNANVVNGRVVLTLSSDLENINRVLISYTKNADASKNIKNSADIAMDSFSVGDISDVFLTTLFKNTTDTSIDLSFTKDISANSNVSLRDFTLKINDVVHTIESVSINASGKVKLQISATSMQAISSIDDVYVKYTKNSIFTEQHITDYNGNEVITSDSSPPTIVDITHPFNIVENIGRQVTGQDYRYESRSIIYNTRNSGTNYKAAGYEAYTFGYSYRVHKEWLVSGINYTYENHSKQNDAVVVFKYNANENIYKFYQFIPYGAIFGPTDMTERNSNYTSSTYSSNYRYFGMGDNIALNDRYMIIGESSQSKYWLYELINNSWVVINNGSYPTGLSGGFTMNEYNYVFNTSRSSNASDPIRIYRIINNNIVKIKDINSPDTEISSYMYFSSHIRVDSKTLVTNNAYYPETGDGKSSGTIYIYDQDKKEFNLPWGLVKKITAPQSWIDIPLLSNDRSALFGEIFDVKDDVLTVLAGEQNNTNNPNKYKIFIYYKNEGGLNNWGLIKEIQPVFNHLGSIGYFGNSAYRWMVTCNKKYILLTHKNGANNEGTQIYSRNQGGQNNWGFLKTVIPEHTQNPESNLQGAGYYGKVGGTNTYTSGLYFGVDNRFTVPQYNYEGKIDGYNSYYNIGRILVVDTDTRVYLTNKISINTTEIIKNSNSYDKNDFTVTDHVGVKTVTDIDISLNSIILTLDSDINDINRVLVTYTKDTTNIDNNIKDLNDNKMDSFTFGDITNPNYLSKQLGSASIDFGVRISGDNTNKYAEYVVSNSNNPISNLKNGYNLSSQQYYPNSPQLLFSRGNLLFMYANSTGPGYIYVYEYKNGKWNDVGNYKNRLVNMHTSSNRGKVVSYARSSYYPMGLYGAGSYAIDPLSDSYQRYNVNRFLSINGLLWNPGQQSQYSPYDKWVSALVPVSKLDNQLYFPRQTLPYLQYFTGIPFGNHYKSYNMNMRCMAFGDDWAVRVERYSSTNDATTDFWFSRLNRNTNRFDYVRKIEANTFFNGSSLQRGYFNAAYWKNFRAYINNDYYVIVQFSKTGGSDYNVWKRDASNNWIFLLKSDMISDQYWGRNSQGIVYNHFYIDCGQYGDIILHDLSNNKISKLQLPTEFTSSSSSVQLDVCDEFATVINRSSNATPNNSRGILYIFVRRSDNYFGLGNGPGYTPNFTIYQNQGNSDNLYSVQIHKETKDILLMTGNLDSPLQIVKYKALYNVILQMNEAVRLRGTEDVNNFSLEYELNSLTIDNIAEINTNIQLQTLTPITNINNVGVIYESNNDITKNIRDIAGNPLNEFGDINTNPVIVSFALDSNNNNVIDITHNRKILNATYNINDYQVKEGNATININSINVDNKIIKLTLSQNITNIDIVEITYTKSTNASENVKDLFNNFLATQVIGSTNEPQFTSLVTQGGEIAYGTTKSDKEHNVLSNNFAPESQTTSSSYTESNGFGSSVVSMGDYIIAFSYRQRRNGATSPSGTLFVYKWNGTTYEYKSRTDTTTNFYSNGAYCFLSAGDNYVALSNYNMDLCCVFKMETNDTLVEDTTIQPSGFSGAIITDINSPHAVHAVPRTAPSNSYGNGGVYNAPSYANQRSSGSSGTHYGYYFRTFLNDWPSSGYLGHGLITTGGHIGTGNGTGRYKVTNPGGVTLKFKIHAGESHALKLQYTTSATTTLNYNYWTHTDVGTDWNEVTLPHGYHFIFSGDSEYRTRAAELEVYVLPFVGFSTSEADRFGNSCAIGNDWLAVGDPYATSSYNNSGGLVFIFKKENGSWVEKQKLEAPISTFSGKWNMNGGNYKRNYFGHHVLIKNNMLFIAHYYAQNKEANVNSVNYGCVYVFKLNTTSNIWEYNTIIASNSFTYTENDSLTPKLEGQRGNGFGVIYGATQQYSENLIDFNGTYFASVIKINDERYIDIFKYSNDDFTFIQRIQRPQKALSDSNFFGSTVNINNDYLLVIEKNSRAPSTSDPAASQASLCHIYKNTNDVWSYEKTLMRDYSYSGTGTWGSGSAKGGLIHGNRIVIGNASSRTIEWDKIEQKNNIDLVFNQAIPVNPNLSVSDFSMIYNAENNPIINISVVGGKVRLETGISVTDISNVKLTYTKNANAAQNIQNSNGVSVDSFVYKGKTTKPIFDSLTVSTNQTISSGLYTTTITLTFTDVLLQNNNIDKNDFSAEYNGSATTVHTAAISSGKVVLTIKTDNNAVADSDFLLTYTKNANTTKNIGDGMDNYVDTFTYVPGFAFRDTTISNSKISLNWTTPLNDTVSIDKDDFTVTIDGNAEVITNAEISGKHVLLTPTNTVTDPTLVRVTYTKNAIVTKNLKSLADNEIVETFSTSPEPASLSSVTLGGTSNPNKIHINWASVSTTNKSRFSKFNFRLRNHRGRFIRFTNIETDPYGRITLTSNENLIGGNRYYLSYRRDFMRNNRIRDSNNRVLDNFSNRPILTNTLTQQNISIETATVNHSSPTKIILEMNAEVTVDSKAGMPFTIVTRGSNNLSKSTIVTSYNIINNNNINQIELNTNRTFVNGDKIILTYRMPVLSQNRIRGSYSGLPNSSRTYNYTVTASNGAFNINGDVRKLLYLNRGDTYVFNLSNASLSGHPFRLSLTSNGSHSSGVEYTEGVTLNGTPGQTGANLTYVVPINAPGNLYYYCSNHSNMGSRIFITGSIINYMSSIYNYDVKNKVGPAVFSRFTKLAANIGTNYGFTENVHSINSGEELGHSVSMDGDYSIIGGPGNNRVLINYFSNNAWAQQKELTGQGSSDKFGISVAISGDTAVVGASNYSSNKGKIYIYKRSGTSWSSQQTIEGETTDDYFGHSVAIDSDTIVVGANEKGSNDNGKIYIYKRSGTTWNLESSIDGESNNDKIGDKVAIKGDVLAYSAVNYKDNRGLVNIYTRSGSTWSKTEEIIGTESNEKIGESLSLDTNILLIGIPEKNKVMMYEYINSEWTRTEELENTDSSKFGSGIDIDVANNNLVIGARSDTQNGKIFVYQKENNEWNKTQDFIGEANGDNYGKSVATSNNRILTSAPNKLKTGGGASAGKFYYHKLLTTERLEVTFDDHLKSNPNIDKDDFTMESDGNTNTIDKVYISAGKLIINHQTQITDTNTVILTYTKNNDATKNLIDLDGSAIVSFTYPEGPSVEQAGIGTIQLRTKVTTVVPTNITKTNGIFDFTSLTIDKGVKTAVDDTPSKKRLRTRTFIKNIFQELKKNDTTYNSKAGITKINKNMLAFTEKVSKRVHDVVRLYDADSTIDMRSVSKGESVYIPLETNESVVISLPNVSSGGTTDYTFTKNADDTTTINPALDGKVSADNDDVLIHGDYNVAIGSIVVGDNPLHLHIPFIFDVSGNILVYGEEVKDTQLYTARHEFTAGDPTSSLTAAKLRDLYFYSDEIEKYTVTVLAGKFALNGESEKVLRLQKGVRYIFDVSDATNATHPFKFSSTKNGTHSSGVEYVTGVRSYGTPGSPDSAVELFVSTSAPAELFYYCGAHSGTGDYGMGSSIKISDKAALFYRGSDASSNIVKDALHADLCSETANIKHNTTHSKVSTKNGLYASPITSTSGNSLGNILVRYIATHLMGHPLAQAFITNDESIENDVNGTGQNQSKIAETLITQFNDNLVADATTPSKNRIIQSLFEQMIAGDINRFMVGDDSGKKPIPFQTGDNLVFYISTKAKLAIDSNVISPATPITLTELFPNSVYPLLSDATGELDSGLWKVTLTIS